MKNIYSKYIEQDIGIILCLAFYIVFNLIVRAAGPYLDGAKWYYFSSGQRLIFGLIELWIFVKLFKKESWKNVINTYKLKSGFIAGTGLILYAVLFAVTVIIGIQTFIDTTWSILFSCLICQQLTTGFWEELTFRAFLLEGYARKKNKTWKMRLLYALLSFAVFGLVHAVECDTLSDAVDRFINIGIFGLVFAAIYIYSHNILVPMLLHFIYDIFANMTQFVGTWNESAPVFLFMNNYVLEVCFVLMPVLALVFVLRRPAYEYDKEG